MKGPPSLLTLGRCPQTCHSSALYLHTARCCALGSNPVSPGWLWREQLRCPELRGTRLKGCIVKMDDRMSAHCGALRKVQTWMDSHSETLSSQNWDVSSMTDLLAFTLPKGEDLMRSVGHCICYLPICLQIHLLPFLYLL